MEEETYQLILGLLIAGIGATLATYAFLNKPKRADNESNKSANLQLKILAIAVFIMGLIYALS